MKKLLFAVVLGAVASGCLSLSYQEKREYRYLQANGIDIDHAPGGFEAPNSAAIAGGLNILPGFGNFYLAMGRGNDSPQAVYGVINLLFWPLSIVWGAPQAAIDANSLNQREMLYFYRYEPDGKKVMESRGLRFE